MALTREYTNQLIVLAEDYLVYIREFLNETISEETLIRNVSLLNEQISTMFFKQSELPIEPVELKNWSMAHTGLSGSIHDFSLFYNEKNLDKWTSSNRKYLMKDSIKRYQENLEEVKKEESKLRNQ